MRRELGGVIACMQELEIACDELGEMDNLHGVEVLAEIRKEVRDFFGKPSKDSAQGVVEMIGLYKDRFQVASSLQTLFNTSITVDSARTNLSTLCDELAETLKDL